MDKIYNHKEYEITIQKKWQENKTYTAQNNPGKLYTIDTPPPTVSGSIHIGHIFSYTQTDIIARYKRMSGYSVFYPFGFDDNGLPTERYVEKKRKVFSFALPKSEFIKICLEETAEAEKKFKDLWQRVGLSADWSKCYSTISDEVRKISQESFVLLYKKGFIYRKKEPALFCTTCYTTVAQAELDDLEVSSTFNDIVFKTQSGEQLVIGTTRPELLPSCVALIYNPNDKRYKHLKNSKAIVPVYDYEVPILEDELVDMQKGTGLVMVCTFGDKNDIEWYKKFKLPYKQSMNIFGKWTENTGPLQGLKVHEARKKILEILQEKGLLLQQKPITHNVNVHERCKKEIEYLEVAQWFIKILEHKDKFIELGDKIKWSPEFMKSRYINWVQNLSWDWGISRQRNFGISFPVWHCADCNEVVLANISDLPVEPQEEKYHNKAKEQKCPKCKGDKLIPDTDVMDTWNTSSLSPQICYSLWDPKAISPFNPIGDFMPMSMRPQAHDIIRTWAFYTIVKSWMHNSNIPWESIIISGHVLAGKEKLSKSKENESVTPENLLEKYSADAIRFWTASGTLGQDTAFSETQLNIGQKLINKLWNAFRFGYEHLQNFDEKQPQNLGLVNEWILHQATESFKQYQSYFEQSEFSLALGSIEKFFWKDFCDNYLEIIKDQLFNPDKYSSQEVTATKWTLQQVGLRILQMYSPYIPHVTEAIYETCYKKNSHIDSVHQTRFADVQKELSFEKSAYLMEKINYLIAQIRKLKTENQISLKTEIENLTIYSDIEDNLKEHEQLIKGITQAKNIHYNNDKSQQYELVKLGEIWNAKVSVV